jgi:hypothetical protein
MEPHTPFGNPAEPSGVAADALIEEYKSLREEILQRCQFQLVIMAATIALVSAFLPLAAKYATGEHLTVLFAAPLVFAATTWLYFEQDIFITQAADYLNNTLAPRLRRRIPEEHHEVIMQWEIERHRMLFVDTTTNVLINIMFWVRLLAVLGAGVAALAVAVVVAIDGSPKAVLHWWDYLLGGIDAAVIIGLAWLSRHVRLRYEAIVPDEAVVG